MTTTTSLPVLLAEDEPVLARRLARQLKACWPEVDVLPIADNGAAAVALALQHLPRVVFLDIHMPACSGLEAAQAIIEDWPDGHPLPQLVFVTAYSQYAVQAFEHEAVDYLLKPVSTERLQATVQRLRQRLQLLEAAVPAPVTGGTGGGLGEELQRLSASMQPELAAAGRLTLIHAAVGNLTHLIPVHEVLYFEAAEKYLRVVTRQREALIRMTVRELLARVAPEQFWQVHRSLVVQVGEVSHVERTEEGRLFVHVRDHAAKLAVSRLFAHRFKAM
jgi:DNA-binding LytR/AlgR family response regulator